jgi:hypothetical protein
MQPIMDKATSLGETEDPTATNRWNESRHTDDRFVVGQVDDLEAMQPHRDAVP